MKWQGEIRVKWRIDGKYLELQMPNMLSVRVPKEQEPKADKANINDLRSIVEKYKELKGIEKDNKAWDKTYFGRFAKDAKVILKAFDGDVAAAVAWLPTFKSKMDSEGLNWTLSTAAKYSWERQPAKPKWNPWR